MNQSHTYDDVPYPDLCYAYTHPGRIAAIATLLGLQPAPVENCRVLELGCAGGGNLIPMAYGLPDSTFTGIDNSARQIEMAQQKATALGLDNITLQTMDIMEVAPDFGEFDYIIVHGIYAWVPPAVQDRLMAICQQNLAPQGVAYISYNTLPGWHMVLMVREMMQYHTRKVTDPRQRADLARTLINDLVQMIPESENSAYAAFLHTYADMRFDKLGGHTDWEDSALLHDELSEYNTPLYFHQFIEHAAQHGLQYLAEADFTQVMMHDLPENTQLHLQEMAHNTIELEQYLDFVRHQTFRRTLLCHESVDVDRTLRAERIRHLYISSRAVLLADNDGNEYFRTHDGSTFPAEHPLTTAALRYLSQISPRAVRFEPLLKQACARLNLAQPTPEDAHMLAINLLQAFTYSLQMAEMMTCSPDFTIEISERPLASPLARLQVQIAPLISNLRHEQVELDGLSRALTPFLDGQHTLPMLVDELADMVAAGQLAPSKEHATPEQIRKQLDHDIRYALRWLSRAALLIG